MVNVGAKPPTRRECVARGAVAMAAATIRLVCEGRMPKGDVLAAARLAGIQAAKRTAEWIPLAHVVPLDVVEVEIVPDEPAGCMRIEARAEAEARTGVEMEALVAVAAAALTLYDMCKAVDRGMCIGEVRLVRKSGGRSGDWTRPGEPARVGDPAPKGRPKRRGR